MKTLYVVSTPIGNLKDISKRALDVLNEVSFILCEDTRVSIKLLNHYNVKKKLISYHKFNEDNKLDLVIEKLKTDDVALISDAGTPLISDPGYLLVKRCRELGIEVIGIPGASALTNALAISGMDTRLFSFFGFLSMTNNKKFKEEIELIKNSSVKTIVIYESPKRIVKLVDKLKEEFPLSNLFIASDMTKLHERSFYGNINDVYNTIVKDDKIEKGEYVLVLEIKDNNKEKEELEVTIEALLVNYMVKEKKSLKEALNFVSKEYTINKNIVYNASLKLKELFNK